MQEDMYKDALLEVFNTRIEELETERRVLHKKSATDFWTGILASGGAGVLVWKIPEHAVPSVVEIAAIAAIGLVSISIVKLANQINYLHEIRGKEETIGRYRWSRDRLEERFFPEGRRI